jgi:hypothetical protein
LSEGNLAQLSEIGEGFKALDTQLFDLIAELDEGVIFNVAEGFGFAFGAEYLVLGTEFRGNALVDFVEELRLYSIKRIME